MAQLWHTSGASEQRLFVENEGSKQADDSLQLKVRCRSSLSVLYDAIWRWRQAVGQTGREGLAQAVEHPTIIPTADTSATNGARGTTPNPGATMAGESNINNHNHNNGGQTSLLDNTLMGATGEIDPLSWEGSYGSNAVFDPLSWALDGSINLNFGGGTEGLGF